MFCGLGLLCRSAGNFRPLQRMVTWRHEGGRLGLVSAGQRAIRTPQDPNCGDNAGVNKFSHAGCKSHYFDYGGYYGDDNLRMVMVTKSMGDGRNGGDDCLAARVVALVAMDSLLEPGRDDCFLDAHMHRRRQNGVCSPNWINAISSSNSTGTIGQAVVKTGGKRNKTAVICGN
ncbi:hypothetical protein RRG08_034321 [Elysia crispata]|uniref:Uncharacterized protein n=1 Tax=Elysia crispata TaxID=231223 RepID=A0AAE1DZT0_9GAST|nr:hypothetical protein RRG08_034321 [Elysia crispata]